MSVFRRMFGMGAPDDNLRIVITRHGERADFALGKQWYRRLQRTRGQDSRVSPLPARTNSHEWNFDSPLTIEGENQSSSVGKKLLSFGYPIDYCYSSPAFRSIQTATKILESQGRKHVPINIEPGLFECPAWYRGKPLKFFHPQELARDRRFHINPHYSPIYDSVDPQEEERKYYKRSRRLIRKIISNHKNTGGTVLLSGHGGSIEAVTQGLRGLLQRRGNAERLIEQALKVDYCNFAILERDARTRKWMVHLPDGHNHFYERQLTMQSSIPLHGVSTHQVSRVEVGHRHPVAAKTYGHFGAPYPRPQPVPGKIYPRYR